LLIMCSELHLGNLLVPCVASIKSFRISNLHSFRELVSWVQFPECLRARGR
jgi:hypothetical protein